MSQDKTDNPQNPEGQDAAQEEPPHVRPGELGGIFGAVGTPPLILTTKPGQMDRRSPRGGGGRGVAFRQSGRRFRMRISALTGIGRYGLAGVAGLLAGLTMAPFFLLPLLPLAFVALIWLVDGTDRGGKGVWQSFAIGWSFGFVFFLSGVYWIGYSFLVDAETYGWMMPFAMAAMPIGLGLFTGGGLALAKMVWRPGAARIVIFAAAFAAFEWLRGHILTGFPWNLTGYAWGGVLEMMQSVSVIGIYGLSFLTILTAASPAALFGHPQERANWRWPFFAVLVIGVLWTAGAVRLYLAPTGPEAYVEGVNLRIVQPNIPQADKWRRENQQAIWDRLLAQTAAPASVPITHVIWPESAVPILSRGVLANSPRERAEVGAVMEEGAVLLTGAQRVEREPGGNVRLYNSFHAMDSSGEIVATYDKHHLVPFGEYLPLRPLLAQLGFRALVDQRYDFYPGPGARTLNIPGAPDIGPLVCYEAIFPGEVVDPRRRPGWLINVTDDSWFGDSSGPRQHLGLAQARAIEEGLPLIRAANTGISAVIDPYGRILSRLRLGEFGVINSPLPGALEPVLYVYLRDWPFIFAILGVLIVAWLRRSRNYSTFSQGEH